eukprot:CAMPEP_0206432482 /NCGR_PEP_ID=MMETSP0324_2-20121206/7964_1 /ASSEMBLY_ACC=CAM_ASM_000836 /TAXON_ID=2866 /ORGANISM="Crypthecodinium cohnii, Strain Seligo" /LENGTH=45 /DNA_ID= /DNA_START= /DNA_END= /DNA_ORIENTATION=
MSLLMSADVPRVRSLNSRHKKGTGRTERRSGGADQEKQFPDAWQA